MSASKDLSVVIPVYNSARCLPELLRRLSVEVPKIANVYELILVEDCSKDESWSVLKGLAGSYPHVTAIRLMRNSGQARATLCGLERAQGEIVVTMDDDLQHAPEQLGRLVRELRSNDELDCVFGCFETKKHAAYRNLGSRIIRWVNRQAFGLPSETRSSSFRVMRHFLASAMLQHQTGNPALAALLFASTHRTKSVVIEHAERYAGKSNYTLARQLRLALDNITNVSMLPLRAVFSFGLVTSLVSLLVIAVVLVGYFSGEITVPGWTSIVISISFFSGMTMLSIGLIGEYLVRVLREVRGAPNYVIRDVVASLAELPAVQDARSHVQGA